MALDALERRVVDDIAERADELVALVAELIAYDTTARALEDPPRDEAPLQRRLAERLRHHGARIDLWEPTAADEALPRMLPATIGFEGRPQLAARFGGAGGGRSLLLNGHVDVVAAEPGDGWSSDPRAAVVRDGLLYGRGACDMKGGVGAMVAAASALQRLDVRLRGDLIVCTTTDEESFGAGGVAAVRRGVRADAGIVAEPSGGDVWFACRGSLNPRLVVEGRAGHAGVRQRHWRAGGAVNAIDKTLYLLDGLRRLEQEWSTSPDSTHPELGPTDCVPTTINGGHWIVTHPDRCETTLHIAYVPGMADADGWGTRVEAEVERWLSALAHADPWLAEHPPRMEWTYDVPPLEIDPREPVCTTALGAVADVGWRGRAAGTDFWHDGATFGLLGGMPVACVGPGRADVAHTVDEHVPVADLVRCAQALAVTAMRFCGTA